MLPIIVGLSFFTAFLVLSPHGADAKPPYTSIPAYLLPPSKDLDSFKQLQPYNIGKTKIPQDLIWNQVVDSNGWTYLLKKCNSPTSCKKEVHLMLKVPTATLPIYSLTPEQHFFVTGPYWNTQGLPLSLSDPKVKVPVEQFLSVATMMAKVIEQLKNAQIMHLDLKLNNWLATPQLDSIRLIEFSNAKWVGDDQEYKGYEPNTAPELRTNKASYSEKSDIWGLGMAFYHLWTRMQSSSDTPSFTSAVRQNGRHQDKSKAPDLVESEYIQSNVIPIYSWFPLPLKKLIQEMTETDPIRRPKVEDVLRQLSSIVLQVTPTDLPKPIAKPPKQDAGNGEPKSSFDRKRYTTLPAGVQPAPLLKHVLGAEELDQGRGGQVFTAQIQADGVSSEKEYVVKRCNNEFPCRKEITMLTLVRGLDVTPDIVAQNPDKSLYAMERLHGDPLRRIDGIPETKFLPIALRMAQIMKKIHAKEILHLDMGFGNWFYDKNLGKIFVIDFGHARFVSDPVPYNGYVNSSAPETRNSQLALPASDIWALGMGYYTLWTFMHIQMKTKTFQAAIKKNCKELRLDLKETTQQFFATSKLPFSSFFPKELKGLITSITNHDPNQRPSLTWIVSKLSQMSL